MDIYGATNSKTGEQEILAIATQYNALPFQTVIPKIQGTTVTQAEVLPAVYLSLWFVSAEKYYLSGDGILSKNALSDASWTNISIDTTTKFKAYAIRGANLSDIFVSIGYLDLAYYNGSTWFDYISEIPSGYGSYSRVAIRGNTVIAVGAVDQNAVLLMGKR